MLIFIIALLVFFVGIFVFNGKSKSEKKEFKNYHRELIHTSEDGTTVDYKYDENDNIKYAKVSLPDGSFFEGEWENGHIKKGIRLQSNGVVQEGIFNENGTLINGKITYSDGVVELRDESQVL